MFSLSLTMASKFVENHQKSSKTFDCTQPFVTHALESRHIPIARTDTINLNHAILLCYSDYITHNNNYNYVVILFDLCCHQNATLNTSNLYATHANLWTRFVCVCAGAYRHHRQSTHGDFIIARARLSAQALYS